MMGEKDHDEQEVEYHHMLIHRHHLHELVEDHNTWLEGRRKTRRLMM